MMLIFTSVNNLTRPISKEGEGESPLCVYKYDVPIVFFTEFMVQIWCKMVFKFHFNYRIEKLGNILFV